ncbi:polymorphic toxin type 30 domain-containing protein [Streptomyces sp. enrichment culture]|uniref:polymorphic toxin type 30 domain-containing protein n=1 Tax=Streptomyces sp. enrichment culture TaxID=1795815 RepID=UPI003F54CCBD
MAQCVKWKWKWADHVTGKTARIRVHAADPKAPDRRNATKGEICRIRIGDQRQDASGRLRHKNVHNRNSPNCGSAGANATRIPWPSRHLRPSYN